MSKPKIKSKIARAAKLNQLAPIAIAEKWSGQKLANEAGVAKTRALAVLKEYRDQSELARKESTGELVKQIKREATNFQKFALNAGPRLQTLFEGFIANLEKQAAAGELSMRDFQHAIKAYMELSRAQRMNTGIEFEEKAQLSAGQAVATAAAARAMNSGNMQAGVDFEVIDDDGDLGEN